MDSQYVQNLRYKLQKRARRLSSVGYEIIQPTLKQFWVFFDSNPSLVGIEAELLAAKPDAENEANLVIEGEARVGEDETEAAAIGRWLLRSLASTDNPTNLIHTVARPFDGSTNYEDCLNVFREVFLEPFYEYVDENLDDERATLGVLLRYKKRSEWFFAEQLRTQAGKEPRRAEAALALDLYAYLWDHGIDFAIEPSSVRGEVDLIGAQEGADPLLADVKIFDAKSRGKTYMRKAFRQVYTYCQQYNRPFGYVVIFKTTSRDLHFALTQLSSDIPFLTYNHKTIFFLTIDIHDYALAVSQRSPLTTVEITEAELVESVEDDPEPANG